MKKEIINYGKGKKTYIYINNIEYQLIKKNTKEWEKIYNECYTRLYHLSACYKYNYSIEKEKIWNKWREISEELEAYDFGVCSWCTSFITITYNFIYEGVRYRAYITPTYHKLIEL